MTGIHGGDRYRNRAAYDFSININPLGVPQEVTDALYEAVGHCSRYPDIASEQLRQSVGAMPGVPKDALLFGNGASELLLAVVNGLKPDKTVIPAPSFYGYAYAAGAGQGEIIYYYTKREENFGITEEICTVLTEDVDLLFLTNPGNPAGGRIQRETLLLILKHCRKNGIAVVLDECFIEFCGGEYSMLPELGSFENLMILRAFTKIFAIPGVRLGYLICGSCGLYRRIERQLPEWNVSCFAQAAGAACAKQTTYIEKTAEFVRKEREFLRERLIQAGFEVFPSEANFLLVYSRIPLYERLLEKGILIRDCANFQGLSQGYYRIAVKTRRENEILLAAIGGPEPDSYRFFANRACKYFPCHKGLSDFNCLFCYCPLYPKEDCPGNPRFLKRGGGYLKDCSDCTFPHRPENYDAIVRRLARKK